MSDTIALTAATMRDDNNEVTQTLKGMGYQLAIHPSHTPPNREEQRALLAGAVGIIAGSEPITREVLEEARGLRVVSRNGIGYDAVDLEAAADLGVVVAYVPDVMAETVADLTFGLLLAVARRIPELDAAVKQGQWKRGVAADVSGQTLGLVGTGRIGLAVARRARAFGMELLGFDPYPNPAFVELGGQYVPLASLYEHSDFISLHTPASAETRGMIGAAALARMKPTAFLINAARGSLVDEAALVEALRAGRLAGAGLDVFSKEPFAPDSAAAELAALPNVVVTPHVASFTPITAARMGRAALENLLAVLRGERPAHVANPRVYEGPLRGS